MKVRDLRTLFYMMERLPEFTLTQVATMPKHLCSDYTDNVIVFLAEAQMEERGRYVRG